MQIKCMQWLPSFHQNKIGHVHDIVDTTYADKLQPVAQPDWAGANLYATDHAGIVARAKSGILNPDSDQVFGLGFRFR